MPNYPHLRNAPIAEAVIEIRVRLSEPAVEPNFKVFGDRLKNQYPKVQQIRYFAAQLQFEADVKIKNDTNSIVGVRLDDSDGKWVVQGKGDGLTVSRLAPYESWSQLVETVRALWPVYLEVFKPEAVVRLGVRYINVVPLPEQGPLDLDTILTAGPRVPDGVPQDLSEFMTRIVLPMPDNGIVLTIMQAPGMVASGSSAGKPGVVVDIDAGCDQSFGPDWSEMWTKLDSLREAKNMAFFKSLTQPAWEQFL